MSSRLFQNIREKQALAYTVYSELTMYHDAGCMMVYAGTSPSMAGWGTTSGPSSTALATKRSSRQLLSKILTER